MSGTHCTELFETKLKAFAPLHQREKTRQKPVLVNRLQNERQIMMIIVIKGGRQCKAGRERFTPYQSNDPRPTKPTSGMKEVKGKTVEDKE